MEITGKNKVSWSSTHV